jgi:hypothetical protein
LYISIVVYELGTEIGERAKLGALCIALGTGCRGGCGGDVGWGFELCHAVKESPKSRMFSLAAASQRGGIAAGMARRQRCCPERPPAALRVEP